MSFLETIRRAVTNPGTAWVLFRYGTVVFLPEPAPDTNLADQATELLQEWGPVAAGSPAGDFRVISLSGDSGWAVGCHHNDILTFVGPDEVPSGSPDVTVGLHGRQKRDDDARQLDIVHIEPSAGLAMAVPPLVVALRNLDLTSLEFVSKETLERCSSAVSGSETTDENIVAMMAVPSQQAAACLTLLFRPSPEGIEALWKAIDDDNTFNPPLLAVAACLDPEAGAKARKRLLLRDPRSELKGAGANRVSCLLELVWQDPNYREWIKSRVDFPELCALERIQSGEYVRSVVNRVWVALHESLPQLCLRRPEESPNLLEFCWPDPWPKPFPAKPFRSLLIDRDCRPLIRWLLAGGTRMMIEEDGRDRVFTAEGRGGPVRIPYPYSEIAWMLIGMAGLAGRERDDGRLEAISQGLLYFIERKPLQECRASMLVTGIDHDGKMKGATAVAVRTAAGIRIEEAARAALAATDRRLGTVVITGCFGLAGRCHHVAHVVSTPKHTAESPGWLRKAVFAVLDQVIRRRISGVVFTALGTNGGIAPDVAARVMLEATQAWYTENRKAALHVGFALPSERVYRAFAKEFRRQKIPFVDED